MIRFTPSFGRGVTHYRWADLMHVIMVEDPAYNEHLSIYDDIKKIKEIKDRLGCSSCKELIDGDYIQVVLTFDDPHKEMLFRLKYLT